MRPKTKHFYFVVAFLLSGGVSLSAQQAAMAKVPTAKAAPSRHVLMEGDVIGHNSQPVDAFHMDVYEIRQDGKRTLARTGHYPSSHYRLYLERGYAYELVVQATGYQTKHFFVETVKEAVKPVAMTLKSRAVEGLPRLAKRSAGVRDELKEVLPDWHPLPELPRKHERVKKAALAEELEIPAEAAEEQAPKPMYAEISSSAPQQGPPAELVSQQGRTAELARTPRLGKTRSASPLLRSLHPDSRALLKLPANTTVDVLEYTTPEWWMVAYRGEMGWVRAQDIR